MDHSYWLAAIPPFVLQHIPIAVFVFCFGACVGSFLNVVIYRLPAGQSVISPPSRCMTCGARLRFFRENLPILGWIMVRGRCRYCGVRISPQYMLIELMMALIFLGLYVALYMFGPGDGWLGNIGGGWWSYNGPLVTWPAFVAYAFMIAGLVAMTVIDARTFTIPMPIPLFVTYTGFIAFTLQAILPLRLTTQTWVMPGVNWTGAWMTLGGTTGLVISNIVLRTGKLKMSFADYNDYVKEGEVLADYPHARREMLVEFKFLLPIIVGLSLGYATKFMSLHQAGAVPPRFLQAVCGTFAGYLVGGGIMWAIRWIGTIAFGREAMGMGDVHLLAAVGAVVGWFEPILIFFAAPFSGILWALISMGASAIFKKRWRELPYGPHLAIATVAIILLRPGINSYWPKVFPGVPHPAPGLVAVPSALQITPRPVPTPTGGHSQPAATRPATRPSDSSEKSHH
ncbi:MAG TPA: prepilin peptidase [Phycisphaerales bacterium]|nr:prepilin peptidase [Phycisphaerales bacterium]